MVKDKRYTLEKEFCGYATKRYVLRFCGTWLQSFEKHRDGLKLLREHQAARAELAT